MPSNSMSSKEIDAYGEVMIPANAYYGPQTVRSLVNFRIGSDTFPRSFLRALALVKRAATRVNWRNGLLDTTRANAIDEASMEVSSGAFDHQFPLAIWQAGSGTQTNMNMNEVLANRANELLGVANGAPGFVHPNDHCNLSQSSNDVIPTAMHIATTLEIEYTLLPALRDLRHMFSSKVEAYGDVIKIGRTHLQDATPLTLGQEFSGFIAQIDQATATLEMTLPMIHALAQGGTAVGTGINTVSGFDIAFVKELNSLINSTFITAENKFAAISSHDRLVAMHGALNTTATALFKIANDIRYLASGPRSGIGELRLPANEAESSIMPEKVNPTQCEALTMVCARVFGNQTTVTFAGSQGHLQLNAYKPVIIHAVLQSIELLSSSVKSFTQLCIAGLKPDHEAIYRNVNRSLMLATCLSPHIGYEKTADIVRRAKLEDTTLRQAAIESGFVTASEFDRWVSLEKMVKPNQSAHQAVKKKDIVMSDIA